MNIVEIITTYKLEIIIALMALTILYLLYYVYEKDSQYSKNIRSIASVVEELNRDLFYLRNKLAEETKKIEQSQRGMSDEEIYQEIERTVYDTAAGPHSQRGAKLHNRHRLATRITHSQSRKRRETDIDPLIDPCQR